MKEIVRYPGCFVCGERNPHGLAVTFYDSGDEARAEIVALPEHEGYKSIFHGGILASLLDEAMVKACLARGIFAVTAELTVRYLKPVPTGSRLRIMGKIVQSRGRIHWTTATAEVEGLARVGEATGKCVAGGEGLIGLLKESLVSR